MRIIIIALFFFLGLSELTVAQISVKSFTELSNDLDARLDITAKKDNNGKPCAIIKVVTTENGFSYDVGMIGVVATTYHPELAEVWVYVPEGTTKIKMSHPQLGQFSTDSGDGYYWFPQKLKSSTCYRLEIVSGRVVTTIEQAKIETGWLVVQSQPDNAEIYLKTNEVEEFVGSTPFQKKLPYGKYEFRIKKNLYHDELGMMEINHPKSVQNITLRPAFGKLKLSSIPEGAKVVIEGLNKQYTTSCITEELPSKEYTVRFMLDNYAPQNRKVTVRDGETTELQVSLDARFAKVTIQSLAGADIFINGEKKGITRLDTDLGEGLYDIEVQLAHHKTKSSQIEVIAKQPQTITLNPEPIYGSLDIQSVPIGAKISIDGKDYGETPMTIENLLEGQHEVQLSKSGYASVIKQAYIKEGIVANLNEILPKGKMVTIETGDKGDEIYLNGKKVGVSPLKLEITYGEHFIKIIRNSKEITYTFALSPDDNNNVIWNCTCPLTPKWAKDVTIQQQQIIKEIINNMIFIQGGNIAIETIRNDEKEVVDNFFINKYEVSQKEWTAIMGYNHSKFRGDDLPVEFITWNECLEFIRKINNLTGLTFSLPMEKEWKYAELGGKKSKCYKFSGSNEIDEVTWYSRNSNFHTHQVNSKMMNEIGLFNMSGNVMEWCLERNGKNRTVCGGSWITEEQGCRISSPSKTYLYNESSSSIGLRLVAH